MMKDNTIYIIAGPTAVGKSKLGILLSKKINGEVISADSMQVYKYMDIGSAKTSMEEREGIPHHLIDIVSPFDEFNVAIYKELGEKVINDLFQRGKVPVIVGGTGLYIESLLYDLKFTEATKDFKVRNELQEIYEEKGEEYLYNLLLKVDEESAKKIHKNNVKRVIRALEVYKITGTPFSNYSLPSEKKYHSKYNLKYFVLNKDRDSLYEDINKRVDKMFDDGLLEEVRNLKNMGLTSEYQSMKGIGYKEILAHFNEGIPLDIVIEDIKKHSRNYAKRQLTWFRKDLNTNWINVKNYNSFNEILYFI